MTKKATFQTSLGTFLVELYDEQMPITVGNFIDLANGGFYDGYVVFRLVFGFR
jgi:cyclophilin family peptidyl-prolyl cis-trans isomerase